MKVILLTQYFPPEPAPIGHMLYDLASGLVQRGHDVTIITGFPNHPSGVVFEGYRKRWFYQEILNGVRVWRVYLYTSPNRSRFNRILTFLTFTFVSCWTILTRVKCDIIFSVLQPLSLGILLPFIAKIKKAHLVFNVQDLHPDALIELGMIRSQFLIRILKRIERYSYRSAEKISVICEHFKRHVISKGISPNKVEVIENWVDLAEIKPSNRINDFRAKVGYSDDDWIVLYAGTIGFVSGAGIILEVAKKLISYKDIKFLFVGEGPILDKLKKESKFFGLNNILFLPFQDRKILNQILATADVALVTLLKSKGGYSVPSKVLAYMAAGRPVIASVDPDSETAKQIKRADCGLIAPAENPDALTEAIIRLKDSELLSEQLGINGRIYLERNLNKKIIIEKYIRLFESLS